MTDKITNWNGYPVHGDVNEIDYIVASSHFINVDMEDIVTTLDGASESWVVTGIGKTLPEAVDNAFTALPEPLDKISRMLLSIHTSHESQAISAQDMLCISERTSKMPEGTDVKWGIGYDDKLGTDVKIVVIASATGQQNR